MRNGKIAILAIFFTAVAVICTIFSTIGIAEDFEVMESEQVQNLGTLIENSGGIELMSMGDYTGNLTGAEWYWPIHGYSSQSAAYSKITSSYGYRGGSYQRNHKGMDIGESKGTAVYSTRSGIVVTADNNPDGTEGRYIIINHNDGYFSIYMHLSSISVSQGQSVNQNTRIGAVGGSGNGSETYYGYHLHFGIHYGKSFDWNCNVNPCPSGYTRIGESFQASQGGYPIGSASINYNVNNIHIHSYDTLRYYGGNHPHYAYYICSCGDIKAKQEFGYFDTCVLCTQTPELPSLKDLYPYYVAGEKIKFLWNDTKNTTHYNIYIRKKQLSGEYKGYENIFYASSGVSRALEMGEYSIILESKNSQYWNVEGTDWLSALSKEYYFTVTAGYSYNNFKEYNGHSYLLFDYGVSWKDAQKICESFGGHLATVSDINEHNEIVSLINNGKMPHYYLGGTDENNEGEWLWITGEPWIIDTLWNDKEPNNVNNIEHYLSLENANKKLWNDVPNERGLGFICEIEKNLSEEMIPKAICEYDGHQYLLFDRTVSWYEAQSICKTIGGHLVTVNSFEENNFIM